MSLSIGIVGLPNVGKSTLFNALTRQSVDAENYPFCTIDPSVGIVPVPDERLDALSRLSSSERTIPTVVEFVDIAGLVEGASNGQGLGNKFLSHIREVDAIAEVVRVFEDEDILHVRGEIDPLYDIEVINLELIFSDLQVVQKRILGLEKEIRANKKSAIIENNILQKIKKALEEEKMVSEMDISMEERRLVQSLNLLTLKQILYVLNIKEGLHIPEKLEKFLKESNAEYVVVNVKIEEDMKEVELEDKETFRKELGGEGSNLDNFITKSYATLDLITFFTTGEKESRAWTVSLGSTAPEAGAAIHSDFRDKFIRAEVIHYENLIREGSFANARAKGLVRTEGKGYRVKDGDVIEFKI